MSAVVMDKNGVRDSFTLSFLGGGRTYLVTTSGKLRFFLRRRLLPSTIVKSFSDLSRSKGGFLRVRRREDVSDRVPCNKVAR